MPDKTTNGVAHREGKNREMARLEHNGEGGHDLFYDESCTRHGVPPDKKASQLRAAVSSR
jgi:hypothetical protein